MSRLSRQSTREQRTTVVYGVLCFVLILVVLILLSAARSRAGRHRHRSGCYVRW